MKLPDWLWPTYRPEEHVIVPPVATKTNTPNAGRYQYGDISITPLSGTLVRHSLTTEQDGRVVHDSEVVAPETDNGRRQVELTTEDMQAISKRKLSPDKAAFLKPYWVRGVSASEAASILRRGQNTQRGYSRRTVADYFAAFAEALPHREDVASQHP